MQGQTKGGKTTLAELKVKLCKQSIDDIASVMMGTQNPEKRRFYINCLKEIKGYAEARIPPEARDKPLETPPETPPGEGTSIGQINLDETGDEPSEPSEQ